MTAFDHEGDTVFLLRKEIINVGATYIHTYIQYDDYTGLSFSP